MSYFFLDEEMSYFFLMSFLLYLAFFWCFLFCIVYGVVVCLRRFIASAWFHSTCVCPCILKLFTLFTSFVKCCVVFTFYFEQFPLFFPLWAFSNDIVSTKIYYKRDDFDFEIVNFPFLALHPIESIFLSSFVLLENLAMLLISILAINC